MMTMDDIAAWRDERDAVLLGGDIDALVAHMRKWGSPVPPNREVAEIALHKARTACLSLPMAERSLSKGWLFARGMTAMDEGDVPLPEDHLTPAGRETRKDGEG